MNPGFIIGMQVKACKIKWNYLLRTFGMYRMFLKAFDILHDEKKMRSYF